MPLECKFFLSTYPQAQIDSKVFGFSPSNNSLHCPQVGNPKEVRNKQHIEPQREHTYSKPILTHKTIHFLKTTMLHVLKYIP